MVSKLKQTLLRSAEHALCCQAKHPFVHTGTMVSATKGTGAGNLREHTSYVLLALACGQCQASMGMTFVLIAKQ